MIFFSTGLHVLSDLQVRVVFLYWLPCLLRMSRPVDKDEKEAQKSQKPSPVTGNLVTRKSIDTSTGNNYYYLNKCLTRTPI